MSIRPHLMASPAGGARSHLTYSSYNEREEPAHQGYLNRKTEGVMGRRTKTVLHRENRWQLFWCKLKTTQLEFYKVEGVRAKQGDPPPRDVYPPDNSIKTRVEVLDVGGALIEIDYVSQENKDIQKRRLHLFRVEANNIEYFLQAPSNNQRNNWVGALQLASGQLSDLHNGSVLGPGHAIKTVRDSIKHNRRQVQRTRSPGQSTGQSVSDDSDYIEFSKAADIVGRGGDPRLQALRKRLQAKKELLKQLDRMYSSYLGGSAAAMYDDSLILQQMEPPVFSSDKTPERPPVGSGNRRRSKPKNKKSKQLTSDSSLSMERGLDQVPPTTTRETTPTGEELELGRRASTGEMDTPSKVSSAVSPPPIMENEAAMETELLTSYYLVPGASWSLLEKGEKVLVLGKAQETGWYRCIALRHAHIKLDHSAFSVLTMTTSHDHRKTRSFDERCPVSGDSSLGVSSSVTCSSQDLHQGLSHTPSSTHSPSHMSLLSSSCPPTSIHGERSGVISMATAPGMDYDSKVAIEEEEEEGLEEGQGGEVLEAVPFLEDELADPDDDFVMVDQPTSVDRESTTSPEFCSIPVAPVSTPMKEGGCGSSSPQVKSVVQLNVESEAGVTSMLAEGQVPIAHAGEEEGCGLGRSEGEVVLRSQGGKHERPLSYKLATDEELCLESLLNEAGVAIINKASADRGSGIEVEGRGSNELDDPNKELEKSKKGKKSSGLNIKRSTSTVTQSSQAAITLRRTLGTSRGAKAQSSRISSSACSLPTSFTSVADAKDSFMMWSRLDNLVKGELRTGSYLAPLIGCVPPSALKLFAELNKHEKGAASGSASGHSQSEASDCNSRPASITVDSSDVTSAQDTSSGHAHSDEVVANQMRGSVSRETGRQDHHTMISIVATLERSSSNGGERAPRLLRSGTICSDDDSDGEADRRMAQMFNIHDTINPDEDKDLLSIKQKPSHKRASSLPPPIVVEISRSKLSPPPPLPPRMYEEGVDGEEEGCHDDSTEEEGVAVRGMESSLDRSPSHMRKNLEKPPDSGSYPTSHSVGSSPAHRATTPTAFGKESSSHKDPGSLEVATPTKSGLLKKLFMRSKKSTSSVAAKPQHPEPAREGLSPGLLRKVLLQESEGALEEDFGSPRLRMASISGRPVRQEGMAILIGDESSSDSEGEEDDHRHSNASSLQDEANFSEGQNTLSDSSANPINKSVTSLEYQGVVGGGGVTHPRKSRGKSEGDVWKSSAVKEKKWEEEELSSLMESSPGRLKRSASDHDSLALKASVATPTDPFGKTGGSSSLKRNLSSTSIVKMMVKKGIKPATSPTSSPAHQVKKGKMSKKKKKSTLSGHSADVEESSGMGVDHSDTSIKITGIIRQPPHGEKRYVYLDPADGKFGFRLQSYGRIREQGQVLQTFVQSVDNGSPAFLAGLYPGDAIVEVNGLDVKYAPVDDVVAAIKSGTDKGERILLKVEFVDGVSRLDCMKKADDFKSDIKSRQARLKELLNQEKTHPPHTFSIPSPSHIVKAAELPVWAEHRPDTSDEAPSNHKEFPHNKLLNQVVCLHTGSITGLECSVLVMPISSCFKSTDPTHKNLLVQLLKSGGVALLDDLSLAKQCKIGDNIVTWGHDLPARYIYHCVFGDLEESLQSCCYKALESAREAKLSTIVFWLDGFAFLKMSPSLVIQAVRHWMQEDMSRNTFQRVIFSSSANSILVESIMCATFPVSTGDSRDVLSRTREGDVVENGDHLGGGGGPMKEEAELDDVMMEMQGLINSLENESDGLRTRTSLSPDKMGGAGLTATRHKSLSRELQVEDFEGEESGRRSLSPGSVTHSHGSGDLVLNPDRLESAV